MLFCSHDVACIEKPPEEFSCCHCLENKFIQPPCPPCSSVSPRLPPSLGESAGLQQLQHINPSSPAPVGALFLRLRLSSDHHNPSIHPSILVRLSGAGSRWQLAKQGPPGFLLPATLSSSSWGIPRRSQARRDI